MPCAHLPKHTPLARSPPTGEAGGGGWGACLLVNDAPCLFLLPLWSQDSKEAETPSQMSPSLRGGGPPSQIGAL